MPVLGKLYPVLGLVFILALACSKQEVSAPDINKILQGATAGGSWR